MLDKTKRPLQIPPWQIPYMEKHRIYELFNELARELIIQQPQDHVVFIKQILTTAAQNRDTSRVILLSSPRVNVLKLARNISQWTKQVLVTGTDLEKCLGMAKCNANPELIGKCLLRILRREHTYRLGWILVDVVKTEKEAKSLIKYGILPTHVIYLIPASYPKINELKYCGVPMGWPSHRRKILELKEIYKSILREVYLGQVDPSNVIKDCVDIITTKRGVVAIIPRVVIIGPRGSGRKCQAKLLAKNLDIVHVDFEYLVCQAWMSESVLGEKLRACKEEICFHSELLSQVVNCRILQDDCLKKGWVLTGYPYTYIDLQYLDCLDTPPNRIIILDCDLKVCKERVIHKRVDIVTGAVVTIEKDKLEIENLEVHPRDNIQLVEAEHDYYCEQYPKFVKYCGATANVVNADQSEKWVHECIAAIIVRATASCPPRIPFENIDNLPSPPSTPNTCCCGPYPPTVFDSYATYTQIS